MTNPRVLAKLRDAYFSLDNAAGSLSTVDALLSDGIAGPVELRSGLYEEVIALRDAVEAFGIGYGGDRW